MKHTPGPTNENCPCSVSTGGNFIFCPLHAAAPELLEAGKAILAKESELANRHAWLEYRALEAAIAKAEGSTP